jgi:DNA polymerase I-like protein with 3'-5' exonuclease and polymerase domains
MDLTSIALLNIYPRLGKWISKCKTVANSGGSLETLLGRKFKLIRSKNELAVLNGVMQGSVAHAMQLVLRRVWDRLPGRIVADQHDGLIVTSAPDNVEIRAVIDVIAPIMLNPFEGVLDENPSFPLQVSIGKKWKKWKLHKIYRESGVINVSKEKQNVEEAENQREGCLEGQTEETEKVGEITI